MDDKMLTISSVFFHLLPTAASFFLNRVEENTTVFCSQVVIWISFNQFNASCLTQQRNRIDIPSNLSIRMNSLNPLRKTSGFSF